MKGHKLRRCLPRPTQAIRLEREANEPLYDDATHAVVGSARDALAKNPGASEATVFLCARADRSSGGPGGQGDSDALALRCRIDDDAALRVLRAVSASQIRQPFERKARVHEYRMDGLALSVEKTTTGDVRVRCWEERCYALDVMSGFAVAATSTNNVKPHGFPSRADLHSDQSFERMTVDFGSGVLLFLDCFEDGTIGARATMRRTDYAFPYKAACAAVHCLSQAMILHH
jgi:hypothetical protein